MDCVDIRDSFRAGTLPAGTDVRAHAQSCSACSQLLENDGKLGKRLAQSPSKFAADELLSQLCERLAAPRGWPERIKELRTTVRHALAATAALVLGALVLMAMQRPNWQGAPPLRAALILSIYGLALAACTRELLAPLSRARRPSVLIATIIVGFSLPWLIAIWPSGEFQEPIPHWGKRTFGCLAFGTSFGAVFFALLWLLDRTSLRSPLSGMLGIVALGLLGNIMLVLHCALVDPLHQVVGHGTIPALSLAAWAVIRRFGSA